MDLTTIAQKLHNNINVVTVSLFVALVISEVLGSVDKIKAGSIYQLAVALLSTLKAQVWPS